MTKEALTLALDGITKIPTLTHGVLVKLSDIESAIKEALSSPNGEAQPEPTNLERHERNVQQLFGTPQPKEPEQRSNEHLEPVAWMDIDEKGAASGLRYWSEPDNRYEVALYTTPPQRKPLTDEQIMSAWDEAMHNSKDAPLLQRMVNVVRAIEAAHGIKE